MKKNIRIDNEDGVWIMFAENDGKRIQSSDVIWFRHRLNGKIKIESVGSLYGKFGITYKIDLRIE